jgi:hypothetical protein
LPSPAPLSAFADVPKAQRREIAKTATKTPPILNVIPISRVLEAITKFNRAKEELFAD